MSAMTASILRSFSVIGWPLGHSPRARSSAACSSMRSAICSLAWSLMLLPSCGASAAPGWHNVVPRRPPWNRGSANRRLLPLCCLPPSSVLRLFLALVPLVLVRLLVRWGLGAVACAGAEADDGGLVAVGLRSVSACAPGGWLAEILELWLGMELLGAGVSARYASGTPAVVPPRCNGRGRTTNEKGT